MTEPNIESLVKKLVRLEAKKEFPEAKEILNHRSHMRKTLKEKLEEGETIPEDSKYATGFKETKGRINYKKFVEELTQQQGVNFEEEKEKYRQPGKKLYYGLKEQLELPL